MLNPKILVTKLEFVFKCIDLHKTKRMSDEKFYKEGEMCKYIPVKATYEYQSFSSDQTSSLITFRAVKGCNTISFISGHTKKQLRRCFWKILACFQMLVLEL